MKGGLGNQLFQYATGLALALRQEAKIGKKVDIKLDVTGYGENNGIDTVRHYALDVFNVRSEIATREEILKLKYPLGIISKGQRFFKAKILRQFNTGFIPSIFNTKKSLYLDGFFQTERYFLDQENEIRKDLTLKIPLGSKALVFLDLIKKTKNSVSLHVRRGDYVQDLKTNQHHGTCNAEYYSKALQLMSSKIGKDLNIFVFSDDIAWVKENMPIPYPVTYVSTPEIKDYEELMLMSNCSNNIIANSSFSWWGAWLNPNKQKIVTAPSRWTMKATKNHKDTVSPTWIRI